MSNKTVRIRMYHVGFGDCFLIILPDKRTILIDAGFHGQGKGEFSGNALPERIRDDLIEHLDPASDGETYKAFALAASAGLLPSQDAACAPFGPAWQVPDTEVNEILPLDGSDIERLKDLVQKTDALFAATKVDGMINSTSLVLVLEIGKARLLFPGDAEWGTWKRILDDEAARTLLKSCTFLKVGHHGSHNATAKTLVEKVLPSGIPALMPTQEGPGKYRSNIPLKDLLDALKLRGITCIRSDRGDEDLPDGFEGDDTRTWTDLEIRC